MVSNKHILALRYTAGGHGLSHICFVTEFRGAGFTWDILQEMVWDSKVYGSSRNMFCLPAKCQPAACLSLGQSKLTVASLVRQTLKYWRSVIYFVIADKASATVANILYGWWLCQAVLLKPTSPSQFTPIERGPSEVLFAHFLLFGSILHRSTARRVSLSQKSNKPMISGDFSERVACSVSYKVNACLCCCWFVAITIVCVGISISISISISINIVASLVLLVLLLLVVVVVVSL